MRPADEAELVAAIGQAAARGERLEIRGGGSKAGFGAPVEDATLLDMTGFAGVIDYDPAELVLTVGAATPLAEVEALIAGQHQMLTFEPFDHGPIYGAPGGAATIGGVVAAGVAGSRRVSGGAARDHLLGFKGVSGRAEPFTGGAKVVKNVTGYDLPKIIAGSWGRLVALTEVTLKVMPAGRARATLAAQGLSAEGARAFMAAAMGSQAMVAAAAHLPAACSGGVALTAIRLEGFGPTMAARSAMVQAASQGAAIQTLGEEEADGFWNRLRTLKPLAGEAPLWRVNVAPRGGPAVVAALEPLGARWLFDWAGGLVWLAFDGDPALVRDAAAAAGGHATLVRGPETLRAQIAALHPPPAGVSRLEARVRRAFDPAGVFETGRFPAGEAAFNAD